VTPGPPEADGLDDLLDRLDALTARLLDPAAPLDRLVADYEEANRLLEAAQARLEAAGRAVERG
jgi:exodeoxyribonuclease VII small subunit